MTEIMSRAEALETRINEMERFDAENLDRLRSALEDCTVFLRESEKAPVYIQERARRLHSLLKEKENTSSYRASQYGPIYRQIDRIKDTEISDYFSPALKKRLDNMYPCQKKKGNTVFFHLNSTCYAIFGSIMKIMKPVAHEEASKFHPGGETVTVFPPMSEAFAEEIASSAKLILFKTKRIPLAVYADEIIDKRDLDQDHIKNNLLDIYYPHRMIPGKFRLEGKSYYLIKTW